MICGQCGTTNEPGRKFCKECGIALAVGCPQCGTPNTADAKFCGNCGSRLAVGPEESITPQAAVATTPGAPGASTAERRLVSVLFADLVGFTTISEGRDPEETRELLSRYFDLAREVITRHGGTVEKFIGDAVMAVWGAPVAREDDAERAVRAALSLVDAVKGLGPQIQARAGVLTGEAAVTLGATAQGMVAGDLVNTASRLQSVAPPGGVLVGESTERAANQSIAFEPAGEQMLKGRSAPVAAFRAVRVVAEMGGKNRTGGLEAPFIGRDDDLRLLKDLYHATARDRRPRLISIMGPAGIGKSRLAWEFSKYIDGLVDDTYWHSGRSPSYGEGITFWALGEMVRRRAGLLETDDEETTRTTISEMVARWASGEAERRWIETALLALLGLGDAPTGGRDELFAAWRTFFERIAEKGTTVLLFEDVQWADGGQLDFIDHLLDWTKSLPVFVITLSRPELLERRPEWGAGRRNFVSLALEPLSEDEMRVLLDGLVPGLPNNVIKAIVGRADGVPLYAVETVRMLLSEGRLREEAGVYEPVGDIGSLSIPETLAALIAARLDALDGQERGVLQAAAVLGQSFTVAALVALSDLPEAQLKPVLDAFVRRELFTVEVDPRSPEHGQYSFVQALIREVAYNQLARNERKSRHLAAARWFESLGDEELAGVLAGHYAAAHRNAQAGAEADALAAQARVALRGAAERAANLGSREQAVAFFRQALDITDQPAERAALLERAATEAFDATPDASREMADEAMGVYRSIGDLRGIARTATQVSLALQSFYRPADAVPILEAAVTETKPIADEPDAVGLLAELARAYANTRDPRALGLVDRVLEQAEQLELMPIIAEGIINRALVLSRLGRYYEPAAILRGVLPLTEAHDLVWARLRALNNLAAGGYQDDVAATISLVEQGEEFSRRTGNLGTLMYFRGGKVDGLLELGRWDEATAIVKEFEDEDLTDPNLIEFIGGKALFHAVRGEHEAARETLELLRPVLASASLPDLIGGALLGEARLATLAGRLDDAYRMASDALRVEKPDAALVIGGIEWAVRVALWLNDASRANQAAEQARDVHLSGRAVAAIRTSTAANVAAVNGDRGAALANYREAIRQFRDLGLQLRLGLCLTDMTVAIPPSEPQAAAAAAEAREIWTRLGSPPMLARLDAALGQWAGAASAAGADAERPGVESKTAIT